MGIVILYLSYISKLGSSYSAIAWVPISVVPCWHSIVRYIAVLALHSVV